MKYINDFTLGEILDKCHPCEQQDIHMNTKIKDLKEIINKNKDGNLDFILKNVIATISNLYLNEIINHMKSENMIGVYIFGDIGECAMLENGKILMPKSQIFEIPNFTEDDLVVDVVKNTCTKVVDWIISQLECIGNTTAVLIDNSHPVCLDDWRFYKTLTIMQF